MKIYSMTATFGKLEHETLSLNPGLNIIQAPNEWGKSTWCAFLLAMLYGLDTRAKSTRTTLADKERYAPWSGSPMSGRIELNWDGRDITIERTTKGRIPMGVFRAFETETGMDVPELTALNCGQMLLGVESSVFRRAGFIRLSDLPVTQDDSLRRRLNALVTTGDESGDGARLEKGLRELKNRCRYNHSGLLPQLEQERTQTASRLEELHQLTARREELLHRVEENEQEKQALDNHITALAYQKTLRDAQTIAEMDAERDRLQRELEYQEDCCAALPSQAEAEAQLSRLQEHREQLRLLQQMQQSLPLPPAMPQVPQPFLGMEPEDALEQVEEDGEAYQSLASPLWWILLIPALLGLLGGGVLLWLSQWIYAAIAMVSGVLLIFLSIALKVLQSRRRKQIARKYGSDSPEQWHRMALEYRYRRDSFREEEKQYRAARAELERSRRELKQRHEALCGSSGIDQCIEDWKQTAQQWSRLEEIRAAARKAQEVSENVRAMAHHSPAPLHADNLNYTIEESGTRLQRLRQEHQQLQQSIGQCSGRMDALGTEPELQAQLTRLTARIGSLEKTYTALELAQTTLASAGAELQRRFAPRISKRAQGLLSQLTSGRYDRLSLGNDMAIQAGAQQEDTLRDAFWRSEGTVDQLYLALRLAVAEELTPSAPLILDDAFVRFDDERLKAALQILRRMAETRQVILFSCQKRESEN